MEDIQPGQYILYKKKKDIQHLLTESINLEENEITAYVAKKRRISKITVKFPTTKEVEVFEVSYEKELGEVAPAHVALQRAEALLMGSKHPNTLKYNLSTQAQGSEATGLDMDAESELNTEDTTEDGTNLCASQFVIMCTLGKALKINENCFQEIDTQPVSHTAVTPHTCIDEGDHIVIEKEAGVYKHGIVLRVMGHGKILTIPNLDGEDIPTGIISINCEGNDVFRVNYKGSVSADQTRKRACSKKGKAVLSQQGADQFATWCKTGKATVVDMVQLKQKCQLKHIRPLYKARITCANDIKVGDHLIQGYPSHWFHFLVTEVDPNDCAKVKCIYCLRTRVMECYLTLDVQAKQIYRIEYMESFSSDEAIRRARTKLGHTQWHPHARLIFVRWAKTGSNEGIEVGFLLNRAIPLSKSQIQSFSQLNPGDAIVKKEKRKFSHYYIVQKIRSEYECEAIESYRRIRKVILQCNPDNKDQTFYKLNYHPGTCFHSEDTVEMALHLSRTCDTMYNLATHGPTSMYHVLTRQKFINFVKTGDDFPIDCDQIKDDRILSLRTSKVTSALQLKAGDHIKRPANRPLPSGSYHHMMVAEKPVREGSCLVLHFHGERSKQKAVVAETEEIFPDGCTYRVHYPERIDPLDSIQFLEQIAHKCNITSDSEDEESDKGNNLTGKSNTKKRKAKRKRKGTGNVQSLRQYPVAIPQVFQNKTQVNYYFSRSTCVYI